MNTMKGLIDYGKFILDVFKQPGTKEEWEQYKLSDDQVAHYHEYGYVSGIKLLEDNHFEILRKELNEIRDRKHRTGHPLLENGSFENPSEIIRRVIAMNVFSDGGVVDSNTEFSMCNQIIK